MHRRAVVRVVTAPACGTRLQGGVCALGGNVLNLGGEEERRGGEEDAGHKKQILASLFCFKVVYHPCLFTALILNEFKTRENH